MTPLNIKLLASPGSPESVYLNGKKRIERLIAPERYLLVENNPDVLFFLTGGTERMAQQSVTPGQFVALIGSARDNAYASAVEVKAYLNRLHSPSVLLDEDDANTGRFLNNLLTVKQSLANLRGKKLGLIGQVSGWLISSTMSAEILEQKLGIKLITIPWNELPGYSECNPSVEFHTYYADAGNHDLTETAKVDALLTDTIRQWNLDAITVECFPLVKEHDVTACLPLAKFNDQGIPAGCEGDLTAIVGMMLGKELTGTVPWIANVNKVSSEGCLFSHCTIAPGLVSEYAITTHFETGKGTAIAGTFKNDVVTIFRLNHDLSKAFLTTGVIKERPGSPDACRTQITVNLDPDKVRILQERPLGNHHLIFPGECSEVLRLACRALGTGLIEGDTVAR